MKRVLARNVRVLTAAAAAVGARSRIIAAKSGEVLPGRALSSHRFRQNQRDEPNDSTAGARSLFLHRILCGLRVLCGENLMNSEKALELEGTIMKCAARNDVSGRARKRSSRSCPYFRKNVQTLRYTKAVCKKSAGKSSHSGKFPRFVRLAFRSRASEGRKLPLPSPKK